MKDKMFSPDEIAERLAVNPATVRSWLRSGRLKGIKAGKRIWRINEEELIRFMGKKDKLQASNVEKYSDRAQESEALYKVDEAGLFKDFKSLSAESRLSVYRFIKKLKREEERTVGEEQQNYLKVRQLLADYRVDMSSEIIKGREEEL